MMSGTLALKSVNLSHAKAPSVPVGGLEALHVIRKGNIHSGKKVLINGAGGSIGILAVQLGRYFGAEMTAVDSTAKMDMLRSIGADQVSDYTREDFTWPGPAYDVIVDAVGKSSFTRSLKLLKPNGRFLLVNPGLSHQTRARWTAASDRQVVIGTGRQTAKNLAFLKYLIAAGQLRAIIDRSFPLEQRIAAHRYVDQGHKKGNVVAVEHSDRQKTHWKVRQLLRSLYAASDVGVERDAGESPCSQSRLDRKPGHIR